jgi:hypothetical protein
VTRDPQHPGPQRFALAQARSTFDRAAQGLVRAVLDVGVVLPLAEHAGDDGAHHRPQRSGLVLRRAARGDGGREAAPI